MKQRVITAVCLLCLLAIVVWQIATPMLVIIISIFAAVAANEIMKCAKVSNKFIVIVGTIFAFCVPFFSTSTVMEPWISEKIWFTVISAVPNIVYVIVLVLAFFLAMLKGYSHTKFEDVAVAIVASVVVPYGFSVFCLLRDLQGKASQVGIYLIFYGLICALGTDTGAQLGGMAFGKTKMAPNISPKKTVEGAVSGIIVSMILNAIALVLFNHFTINNGQILISQSQATFLLIAVPFISFMGMMGDLTASVLKRNFEVKDFGKIFPGHGGVMDRFDSSMFTLPLTYALSLLIF